MKHGQRTGFLENASDGNWKVRHDDLYRADPAALSLEKLTDEPRPQEATVGAHGKQQGGTVAGFSLGP